MDSLFSGGQGSSSISYIVTLFCLGLLPLALMATTSYLKISVVLSVLRNALGGGQIPSQALTGIIAIIISAYTMSPVFEKCLTNISNPVNTIQNAKNEKKSSIDQLIIKIKYTTEPLQTFLKLNTGNSERLYFTKLQLKRLGIENPNEKINCSVTDTNFEDCISKHESISSLIISFVSSELRSACTIGVYLFIPFLVVDLIISTILTGMGMMMVSPITISLPLKLLLFVLSDGWKSLIESLILSYKVI